MSLNKENLSLTNIGVFINLLYYRIHYFSYITKMAKYISRKSCPVGKVMNPKTKRCVLGKPRRKSTKCPSGKSLNPKTRKCVSRKISKSGRKGGIYNKYTRSFNSMFKRTFCDHVDSMTGFLKDNIYARNSPDKDDQLRALKDSASRKKKQCRV